MRILEMAVLGLVFLAAAACTRGQPDFIAAFDVEPVSLPEFSSAGEEASLVIDAADLPREWICPVSIDGSDRRMKMYFHPKGRLEFLHGFESHNPARWEYDPQRQILYMYLPGLNEHVDVVLRDYKARGIVLDYCYEERFVAYRFRPGLRDLVFFGFNFNPR